MYSSIPPHRLHYGQASLELFCDMIVHEAEISLMSLSETGRKGTHTLFRFFHALHAFITIQFGTAITCLYIFFANLIIDRTRL